MWLNKHIKTWNCSGVEQERSGENMLKYVTCFSLKKRNYGKPWSKGKEKGMKKVVEIGSFIKKKKETEQECSQTTL